MILLCLLLSLTNAHAAEEGMRAMPRISPKKSFTVESKAAGEQLQDESGFGANEPEVAMKNLMMVGGSGMEGMDMSTPAGAAGARAQLHRQGHQHAAAKEAAGEARFRTEPSPAHKGVNVVVVELLDTRGAPRTGLALQAEVAMATMDMGTQHPRVRETKPGRYELKANFSMRGPWNVKVTLPEGERVFEVEVP